MNRPTGFRALGALVVMSVALLAGCSSAGSSTEATASDAPNSQATTALAAAYKGAVGTPPTVATKPKAGISLWVVSCGQQIPSCATPVAGVEEAAKALGWQTKMCDGQLNPTGWGNCIRQAASAKANIIIPVGIDCVAVQAPMQEATAAGSKIIGGGGADCDAAGGTKIMASERLQLSGVSIKDYWKMNGKFQADWLIGRTNGAAKVVLLTFTDPLWGPWITEGFKEELATCSGCSIATTLEISNNDMGGNGLAQKFSTALLQNATANAVSVPIGGWMQAGLSQAIQSSGRAGQLYVASGFGDASTMDLIRSVSYPFGAVGYASEWGGYGSVDTAIRVLNGETPQVQGDGFQMVDKDHNLPASGDYQGGVDFKSAYRKLWGLS
jgi:ribose transport system substrate-binding protein